MGTATLINEILMSPSFEQTTTTVTEWAVECTHVLGHQRWEVCVSELAAKSWVNSQQNCVPLFGEVEWSYEIVCRTRTTTIKVSGWVKT